MSTEQQPSPGVLNSLLRVVSTRKPGADSPKTASAGPPAAQKPSEDHPTKVTEPSARTTTDPAPDTSTTAATAANAPAHREKRDSYGYLGRLKSLAVNRKDKKVNGTTTTADQPPSPPSKEPEAQPHAAPSTKDPEAAPPASLPEVAELAELAAVAEEYTNPTKPTALPAEPSALAKLIQSLIDALPPLSPDDPVPKQKPVRKGPDGKPIPPSDILIKDPRVIAQLSSPSIMNGSSKTGKKSVWSVLERLGPAKHDAEHDPGGEGGDGGGGTDNDTDSESIMLYAPLHPTNDSVVEIAMSELRPVVSVTPKPAEKAARYSFPWGNRLKPPQPTKLVQVWVPSRTKLSVEIKWWGYRLYVLLHYCHA